MAKTCIAGSLVTGIALIAVAAASLRAADAPHPARPTPSAPAADRSASADDAAGVPAFARPLLGCWQLAGDPNQISKIGPDRIWSADHGAVIGRRVRFERPGVIIVPTSGTVTYAIAGDVLTMTAEGHSVTATRVAQEPASFRMVPMALPAPTPVDDATRARIVQDLAARFAAAQAAMSVGDSERGERIDRENADALTAHLLEVGWIDAQRFGAGTEQQACLIAQQSRRPALVLAAVAAAEADVRAHRLEPQSYAMLVDVSRAVLADPQEYGTQVEEGEDGKSVVRVRDAAHLDELRRAIGLPPISASTGPEHDATIVEER